jgi:hypothetical protein
MMPTDFDESNMVLDKPLSMTREQCDPLCVWQGDATDGTPMVISCWKLTQEELEEINKTGRVFLQVIGHAMPPVCLTVKTPFVIIPEAK